MTMAPAPGARSTWHRPTRTGARVGALLAVAINLALIGVVTVSPGWRALPFLTADFAGVLGIVLASLSAGVVVNLVYVVVDRPWLRRLGDAATAALACLVLARLWAVFPFDLGGWQSGQSVFRVVLGLLTIATAIGVVANLAELGRLTTGRTGRSALS